MNIYVQHGNYRINSQGLYKVVGNLKRLLHEKGRVKSAENLAALSFQRNYQLIPLSAKVTSLDSPFKFALA
jgi:hypothetical protein